MIAFSSKKKSFHTLLAVGWRRYFSILITALCLSLAFGCKTTALIAKCSDWTFEGSNDSSLHNNYRIGVTIRECAFKCKCTVQGPTISCESGDNCGCFSDCAEHWEVKCSGWTETPVVIDFITREPIK